jgi:hypothetical protein
VRCEYLPSVPPTRVLDGRPCFDPEGIGDTETVFVAE